MGCCWISDWGQWLAGLILHLGVCVYEFVFGSFCGFGGCGGGDGACGCGGLLVAMGLVVWYLIDFFFFFFYGFGSCGGGLVFLFVCEFDCGL